MDLVTKFSKHERAIRNEIAAMGGKVERERHNKHIRLYWKLGTEKFVETISCSSSDPNATSHALRDLRQRIRIRGCSS